MEEDYGRMYCNGMTEDCRLICAERNAPVRRQGDILYRLIREKTGLDAVRLLDCTCGVGAQTLAPHGHALTAAVSSPAAVEQVPQPTAGAAVGCGTAGWRSFAVNAPGCFDVVLTCGNRFSHLLTDTELWLTAKSMWEKLAPRGMLLISFRDYERLSVVRGRTTEARVLDGGKRIIFQLRERLESENICTVDRFVVRETDGRWKTSHTAALFRTLSREEMTAVLTGAGFTAVEWHAPEGSGDNQPVVTARKRIRGEE